MPATIFSGSKVKTLKDTLNLNGGSDIITSTTDPTTSAVSAEPGSLLLNKTTGFVYRKLDSGSSTNWTLVGSEAGGAKSYATGNDSTGDSALGSGWTTADVTAYPPTTYSGGTVTATFARTTSSPLQGAGSMLFTPGGQYDSAVFTFPNGIDRSDFARMHKIEFDYEIGTVASYTDGDVKLAVVCASDSGFTTNVQVIQPAGHSISKVSGQETHVATFQSHASNLYYKIFLIQTTASTGYTLKIDNFKVGPQSVAYGAPVTDWVSYTPTGSWVSNTNYSGKWRRVGDTAEYSVEVDLTGAPTAASLSINLASGQTIDTTKMVNSNDSQNILGIATVLDSGTQNYRISEVRYNNTTSVDVWGPANSTAPTDSSNINSTTPFTFASGDRVWVQFSVPILGWSSNVVVSDSADTRVVSFRGSNGSTQSLTAGTTKIAVTTVRDSHSAWDGDEYVVSIPGDYFCTLKSGDNSGTTVGFDVYVDGSNYGRIHNSYATSAGENGSGSILIPGLLAGQRIDFRCNSSITAAPTSISVFRLSGPAQIAASESVSAKYTVSGTKSTTNSFTVFDYDTKVWDSHGAVTTGASWKFIAPTPGEYEVKMANGWGTNTALAGDSWLYIVELYKNGTTTESYIARAKTSASYTASATHAYGSGKIKLLAGEYIQIRIFEEQQPTTTTSTATDNWIEINKVGNY